MPARPPVARAGHDQLGDGLGRARRRAARAARRRPLAAGLAGVHGPGRAGHAVGGAGRARPRRRRGAGRPAGAGSELSWFVCPRSGPLLAGALLIGLAASVYWTFAVDLADQAGLGRDGARLLLGVVGAASIAGSLGGDLLERLGARAALAAGALLMATALALLASAPARLARRAALGGRLRRGVQPDRRPADDLERARVRRPPGRRAGRGDVRAQRRPARRAAGRRRAGRRRRAARRLLCGGVPVRRDRAARAARGPPRERAVGRQ